MRMITGIGRVVCMAIMTAGAVYGQAPKLTDWRFNQAVQGEYTSADKLKGKVVVLDYWGVRCGPCVALLPHMAKMAEKYQSKGLEVVGIECQMSPDEAIKPLLAKNGVKYTVVKGAMGPGPSGLPYAFVLNREGNVIYQGKPSDKGFEDIVKKAVMDGAPKTASRLDQAKSSAAPTLLFEQRKWINSEGKEIVAAVKEASESEVKFILANGSMRSYPMSKLSAESKREILHQLKQS